MSARQPYPVTEREHAFTTLLLTLRDDLGQPPAVRRAVEWALVHWRAPQDARGALFANADDADARLAAIRLGLLQRLAVLGPEDGIPHVGLVADGNPSVGGWLSGIRVAVAQATGAEPAPVADPPAPTRAPLSTSVVSRDLRPHRHLAMTAFATDLDAHATSPTHVVVPDIDGALGVGMDVSWRNGLGFGTARVPLVELRSVHDDGGRRSTWQPEVDEWRAWSALACGLYAADRLALPAVRAAVVRRCLLEPLSGLLAGALDGRGAVELAVTRLDCADGVEPRPGPRGREPRSAAFAWPAAHAAVLGAIDRLVAGGPSAPPARRPVVGAWVEVWDDDLAGPRASGWVVGQPGRLRRLRFAAARRRARRSDGPPVWVHIGDADEPVPLRHVRIPRPCSLFG